MKINLLIIFLIFLIHSSCYYDVEAPKDNNVWPIAHPNDVGMDSEQLIMMNDNMDAQIQEGISSIIIIKNDHLVFENYYFDYDRSSQFNLNGVSTCLSNLAIGKAITEGLIGSVKDPIYTYLPQYADIFEQDENKKKITFEHLMSMTSSFAWNEFGGIDVNRPNDLYNMVNSADWAEYILSRPLEAVPGGRYAFNSGMAMVLAKVIEIASGDSYQNYLLSKVFPTMEIDQLDIGEVGDNQQNAAWGVTMTSMDIAKIGYLYLKQGDWFGLPLIDQDFAVASTTIQTQIDFNNDFGWMWWKYSPFSGFASSVDVNDVFFAASTGEQRLYVVPHLELVVVITGSDNRLDFSLTAPIVFQEFILPSAQ